MILLPCCLAIVGKTTNHPNLILFWGKKKIYYDPKAMLRNEQFKYITELFVLYNELSRKYDIVFLIIPLLKCY